MRGVIYVDILFFVNALIGYFLLRGAALLAGRIAIPIHRPFQLERGYFLCQPAGRPASHAMEDFRQWLLAQAATDNQRYAVEQ